MGTNRQRGLIVASLLAAGLSPSCDSRNQNTGSSSSSAPAVRMAGSMHEWLSDGNVGLLVPSVSTSLRHRPYG